MVTWNGKSMSIVDWAQQFQCTVNQLRHRINRDGLQHAFTYYSSPIKHNKQITWNDQSHTLTEWAAKFQCQSSNLQTRINKHGLAKAMTYYSTVPPSERRQGRSVNSHLTVRNTQQVDPMIDKHYRICRFYLNILYHSLVDPRNIRHAFKDVDHDVLQHTGIKSPSYVNSTLIERIKVAFQYKCVYRQRDGKLSDPVFGTKKGHNTPQALDEFNQIYRDARNRLNIPDINKLNKVYQVPTANRVQRNNEPERKLYVKQTNNADGTTTTNYVWGTNKPQRREPLASKRS